MTSVAGPAYVTAALTLYPHLPDTPRRSSQHDQKIAQQLFDQGVPLAVVESALLLGLLRRRVRPRGALPLPPVRSLAYFLPVIAELQRQPLSIMATSITSATSLWHSSRRDVQKSTFSLAR